MNKPLLITAAVFIACCSFLNANAQTDSTYFDLGRVQLKKTFTQSITIKGSDLERYQFADLSDAINAWLYVTYTNASNLVYVVDGTIINDVNAYSIYDIDEMTFIQNAAAQISGANPAQQLIVIKTRINGPGKQGIRVAGQSSLVDTRSQGIIPNEKGTTELYNNYYLSAYKNYNNTHFGISADYQRDVLPVNSVYVFGHDITSRNNRFKLNGYADTKLWKGTVLKAGVNYVPQNGSYGLGSYFPSAVAGYGTNNFTITNTKQHDFTANISLNSQVVKGLTNTLSAAYNHFSYSELDSNYYASIFPGNANITSSAYSKGNAVYNERKFLLSDNLVYHANLEGVHIEPSVNFTYRNLKDSSGYSNQAVPNGSGQAYQQSYFYYVPHIYLLTPSLNIYYSDIFNIQGGAVIILNSDKDFSPVYPKNRTSPFITTTLDIGKITKINNFSWKLFGSFSRQNPTIDDTQPSLFGFYSAVSSHTLSPILGSTNQNIPLNGIIDPYAQYNSYMAGTTISLFNRLTFNYTLEYRYYQTPTEITLLNQLQGGFADQYIFFNDRTTTNHFALYYDYNSAGFSWRTGLSFTESKLELVKYTDVLADYAQTHNDFLSNGHRWSGGFTNRFTYKKYFAGLDVLYQFGERPYSLINVINEQTGQFIVPANNNSFALQNLYIGSQVKISHLNYAEIFINTRNILQNKSSDITDNRRFVGLGFKVGL